MPGWLSRRREAWSESKEPPGEYPFDRIAIGIYRAGLWLAPSWWLVDTRKGYKNRGTRRDQGETALYVLCCLLVLVVFWLISPSDDTEAMIFGILALYRLFEIALSVLGFLLGRREPKIARSLITIGILALQVVLVFAIVDHSFARTDFLGPRTGAYGHQAATPASTPFEYLYLSWTYMSTLGNQYTPTTGFARALVLATNTWGLMLLGVVAARAIALIDEAKGNQGSGDKAQGAPPTPA